MEEQFNEKGQAGWTFAADAAIITDETADSEDRKHTLGDVSIAVESNLGPVVGEKEGAVAMRVESPRPGKMRRQLSVCGWSSTEVVVQLNAAGLRLKQ